MPAPLALGPAALTLASKQALIRGAASSASAASSVSLAYLLGRLAWHRIPDWIKSDVAVANLCGSVDAVEDDLASLASVLEKLQALLAEGAAKLGQDEPVGNWHAALLAYWQLSAQLRRRYPKVRDERYHDIGSPVSSETIASLKESLDWAIYAYEACSTTLAEWLGEDFELIDHDAAIRHPGHVGHFVAVSHRRRLVVVGVKGTSTLEDLVTDCCGRAVNCCHGDQDDYQCIEVTAEQAPIIEAVAEEAIEVLSGHEQIYIAAAGDEHAIRCHEGILIGARRLVNRIESLLQRLAVEGDYQVVWCGHSLGAGAASLAAELVRLRHPDLAERMTVVAFAPPPVLDHDSALAAAPYTTSIVNNADVIPRSSLANLAVLVQVLRVVARRLQERKLGFANPATTTALLQKLTQGAEDDDLLLSLEEISSAMAETHRKLQVRDTDHLYVPGKVIVLYQEWATGQRNAIETNGVASILRWLEVDSFGLATDHLTSSYYAAVDALSSKKQTRVE